MNEKNGLVAVTDRRELRQLSAAPINTLDLVRIAVDRGASLEQVEKFMDLHRQAQADDARKAYAAAFAAFKADPPDILKNKQVNRGNAGKYSHATHDEVTGKVSAALARHGLSHSWTQRQADGLIFIGCRIMHEAGHLEQGAEMYGPPDTSGSKSQLQAIASTVTFLQRYTLLAMCGLSSREMREADDDAGHKATAPAPEGYDGWAADMIAKADEGMPSLMEAWEKSKREYRLHTVKYAEEWWADLKAKAEEVGQ